MEEPFDENQESDLESLVRTLNESSIDQEMRNLLVLKTTFLSGFMKSTVELAKQPVMQSTGYGQDELVHSLHGALETIVNESTILLKQFDEALEEARAHKVPPSVAEVMAFLSESENEARRPLKGDSPEEK